MVNEEHRKLYGFMICMIGCGIIIGWGLALGFILDPAAYYVIPGVAVALAAAGFLYASGGEV